MKTRFPECVPAAAIPRWAASLLLVVALASAWASGPTDANLASDATRLAGPANAAVPVPPMAALPLPMSMAEPLATPGSVNWQQANAEVGQFPRGHMDILKWEAANHGATPPSAAPANKGRP